MLDIEIAGALAPKAKIAAYVSTFDEKGLIDAIGAAISDKENNPTVLSISWRWDENQLFQGNLIWSPAAIDHVNHSFLAAALLGITICVSTGDDGSEAQILDGHATLTFPQDHVDLVNAAHNFTLGGRPYPIRIILDVVINNSGDNWEYKRGPKSYNDGQRYEFGNWKANLPIPEGLRDPDWYHRFGSINNYDTAPENQLGDIVSLKDYWNEDDAIGSAVINTLIKTYAYWIRNADIDGFRVDAVKHMGPLACSRFCSNIREVRVHLGKRGFFLFGEVAQADDDLYNRYIGQNTSVQDGRSTVFFGLDSVLDFRLAEGEGGGGSAT